LGKEAAGEAEKQMEVITNPELNAHIRSIGSKLAAQPQARQVCLHVQGGERADYQRICYDADTGQLARMKAIVAKLPAPKRKTPAQTGTASKK